MTSDDNESAADWHARLQVLEVVRADEDRHRQRLRDPAGLILPLDNAYMDAVDRSELAGLEVLEAEKAVQRELFGGPG